MISELLLSCLNFITSGFTAITGVGGGMMLIGFMPMLLPAAAIVPVHGVTQLASNASRAWFGRDTLNLEYFWAFLLGTLTGIVFFGIAIQFFQLELIPLFIGIYILLSQWSDTVNRWLRSLDNFYLIGFLQTGLGLFVGTPGPLAIALLNRKYSDAHTIVSVGALMMVVAHAAKIPVYLFLGFEFAAYCELMLMMVVMATLGSWVGTRIRHRISVHKLKAILPWLLSIIAIKLILTKSIELGWLPWLSFF